MALWDKLNSQGNVEDRRGMGPGTIVGGGLGITGIVIFLLLNLLSGGNVNDVLNQLQDVRMEPTRSYNAKDFEGADNYEVFVSKVLGSSNDMWTRVFAHSNLTYHPPTLVLFRGFTDSKCGGADSRVGPHYCPLDQTIYLDETFFDELNRRFATKGGDVAEAYVIAHEVGHHVQHELKTLKENTNNAESIRFELQADCFAGLWANSIKDLGVFQSGDIQQAIDEASVVGDDRIQEKVDGRINPESWTHGSSAERVGAFTRGFESGSVSKCSL